MSKFISKLSAWTVTVSLVAVQVLTQVPPLARAANLVSDFRQCANEDTVLGDCHWIGSIVQASNSKYYEGMSVPQRTIFTDIAATPGDVHTLTFNHLATKGGKHAYDWLTSYEQAVTEAAAIGAPFNNLSGQACYPEIGPPNDLDDTCTALRNDDNKASVDVPDDSDSTTQDRIDDFETTYGNREISIYSPNITGTPTLTMSHVGSLAGDSDLTYTLTWTSTSSEILIEMAGHLAVGGNGSGFSWGSGQGSSSISGAAYHFSLDKLDGKSLGSQDNQVSSSAVLPPQAHLTVVKNVTNDNGGTLASGDFTMHVAGNNPNLSSFPGSSTGTVVTLDPGNYSITENSMGGYSGTFSADCVGTLLAGDNKTCTVTNDDVAAQLTVVKHVVADNGGNEIASDFTMNVTGTNVSTGSFPGSEEPGTTVTLNPGSYSVAENGPAGYVASNTIGCSGTIALGEHKFCTFTNDDQPAHITLVKNVVNDNGGTAGVNDFGLTVGGNTVSSGTTVDVNANAPIALNEAGLTGYEFVSISGSGCPTSLGGTVTLNENQSLTCTITNNDIQPTLTVTKVVVNDNGGTAVVANFPLLVNATSVTSGAQNGFNVGNYIVSETNQPGYTGVITGDCDASGNISLALADNKSCTITNNDNAPSLTLVKVVTNDNGGIAVPTNWTLSANGPSPISGNGGAVSGASFDQGTYSLSESAGPVGYSASSWTCVGGSQVGSDVTLSLGQSATCSITNNDIAPSLTLTKTVINDNGGTATAADWTLTATGPTNISGAGSATSGPTFSAGTYVLSEASPVTGYSPSAWACIGGSLTDSSIVLAIGESAACNIVNDDIAPQLTVIKHVINDTSGTKTAGDFTMVVANNGTLLPNFPGNEAGTTLTMNAGTYSATEEFDPAYAGTFSADCTGTLALGETKTCTITNNDIAGTRTQGFWQTHTSFTNSVFSQFFPVEMTVGSGGHTKTITNIATNGNSILYGAYYSSIPTKTDGKKRTNIEKARMQLLQQLVTAKLNCAAFGCTTDISSLIIAADNAYAGTNTSLMLNKASLLDAYNNSGDSIAIPSSLGPIGSATPSTSQLLANKVFWNAP